MTELPAAAAATSVASAPGPAGRLPDWDRPLAVVAHPDDESFGLGAILSAFVESGARPSALCFTHGEASTLHGVRGDLRRIRAAELAAAARLLGLDGVELLHETDGALADAPPQRLVDAVQEAARRHGTDGLLVFDVNGITGHHDHIAATRAATDAARRLGLPVLAWVLPDQVAATVTAESGATFHGRAADQVDLVVPVRRDSQLAAVRAHPSQAVPGSVLWRRLELLGDVEHLAWLVPPS